jgi:putative SOS response-associated peptidase YedK
MSERYVSPAQAELERYWQLAPAQIRNPVAQSFEVSPTAVVPILYRAETGLLELVVARWGLIPLWWKESKRPRNTFEARSEEAATKPIWRYPTTKSRCLVPALGWFDWKEVRRPDPASGELKRSHERYLMRKADREPMAFAGLMSRRILNGEKPEFSCAILTRDAVGPAAAVHDRMPVALAKDAEAAWLDPELTDAALMIEFARDNAITDFLVHLVDAGLKDATGAASAPSGGAFADPT